MCFAISMLPNRELFAEKLFIVASLNAAWRLDRLAWAGSHLGVAPEEADK